MGNRLSVGDNNSSFGYQVADFLEFEQLHELFTLNKDVSKFMGCHNDQWYRYLCKKITEDYEVFVPGPFDKEKPLFGEWPDFVRTFYQARKQIVAEITESEEEEESSAFQIGVLCRLTARKAAPSENHQREVVLPLHQRMALLIEQFPQLSKSLALRAIMEERGRSPLTDPFQDSEVKHDIPKSREEEKVKVQQKMASQASILSHTDTSILAVAQGMGLQSFEFDRVLPELSSQEEVYRGEVRRVVIDFVNGHNGCIICYGQTGSGKTYTMFGPPELPLDCRTSPYRGIAPRAFQDIFLARKDSTVSVSYVEVYGNAINDLLNEGRIVGQYRDDRHAQTRATDRVGHRYVLDGDTAVPVSSLVEVETLLRAGAQYKRQAATQMNERSTRAHSLLVVTLETKTRAGNIVKSRLFLADLGGSERISKSKAGDQVKSLVAVVGEEETRLKFEEYYHHRERIQETMYINQGLFALKNVIKALLIRRDENNPSLRIPYHDNKLTMLLESGLRESASRTIVLATLSMDPDSAYESLQTLRFAEACKNVVGTATKGDSTALRIALEGISKEIKEVEELIKQKERWEDITEKRVDQDTVAGGFGEEESIVTREEVVMKSVLVGAEKERELLENLLHRERAMLGLDTLGKEFRDKLTFAKDGGLGADFRETTFSKRLKAKDFENLTLLADGLRFLFRKTSVAKTQCGETEETMKRRLRTENIPQQYHIWAAKLREIYDENDNHDHSFGKVMLDQFKHWSQLDREEGVQRMQKVINMGTLSADQVTLDVLD